MNSKPGSEYEGKKSPARLRRTLEDNIKMNLEKIGCQDLDWIRLAQDRVLLWPRQWNFGSHKRREISWPAERLSASQGLVTLFRAAVHIGDETIRQVSSKLVLMCTWDRTPPHPTLPAEVRMLQKISYPPSTECPQTAITNITHVRTVDISGSWTIKRKNYDSTNKKNYTKTRNMCTHFAQCEALWKCPNLSYFLSVTIRRQKLPKATSPPSKSLYLSRRPERERQTTDATLKADGPAGSYWLRARSYDDVVCQLRWVITYYPRMLTDVGKQADVKRVGTWYDDALWMECPAARLGSGSKCSFTIQNIPKARADTGTLLPPGTVTSRFSNSWNSNCL
jgi:hypothetical protein